MTKPTEPIARPIEELLRFLRQRAETWSMADYSANEILAVLDEMERLRTQNAALVEALNEIADGLKSLVEKGPTPEVRLWAAAAEVEARAALSTARGGG